MFVLRWQVNDNGITAVLSFDLVVHLLSLRASRKPEFSTLKRFYLDCIW